MVVDLKTEAFLHPRLILWKKHQLPRWLQSLYAGDIGVENEVEASLLRLVEGLCSRVEMVGDIYKQRGLFRQEEENSELLESHIEDANRFLRDLVSLRPSEAVCPIRRKANQAMQVLRSFGGLRPAVWDK